MDCKNFFHESRLIQLTGYPLPSYGPFIIRSTSRFCFCFFVSLTEYAGEYSLFLFEEESISQGREVKQKGRLESQPESKSREEGRHE